MTSAWNLVWVIPIAIAIAVLILPWIVYIIELSTRFDRWYSSYVDYVYTTVKGWNDKDEEESEST